MMRSLYSVVLVMVGLASVPAMAGTDLLPQAGESLVGHEQLASARHEDTLLDIARQLNLGYEEIKQRKSGCRYLDSRRRTRWLLVPKRRLLPRRPA